MFQSTLISYLRLLELDPLDGERKGLFGRGELLGVCLTADQVTLGVREEVSVPLSADRMLSKTSGVSCVSMPTLTGVGEDTRSRKLGPCSGTLKGVFTMVSSCLRKEGRNKDTRVAKEMGSGVVLATPSSVPPIALSVLSAPRLSGPVGLALVCRGMLLLPPPTP